MEHKVASVIFTRHELTPEQTVSLLKNETIICQDLANRNLYSEDDVNRLFADLQHQTKWYEVVYVYGVIPAPLRELLQNNYCFKSDDCTVVYIYEAWNIQRSIGGRKPSSEFKEWCMTGEYYFPR